MANDFIGTYNSENDEFSGGVQAGSVAWNFFNYMKVPEEHIHTLTEEMTKADGLV